MRHSVSVFSEQQYAVMQLIAEMIIPQTDTPGAIEAGVPVFIDRFVSSFYGHDDRAAFLTVCGC